MIRPWFRFHRTYWDARRCHPHRLPRTRCARVDSLRRTAGTVPSPPPARWTVPVDFCSPCTLYAGLPFDSARMLVQVPFRTCTAGFALRFRHLPATVLLHYTVGSVYAYYYAHTVFVFHHRLLTPSCATPSSAAPPRRFTDTYHAPPGFCLPCCCHCRS